MLQVYLKKETERATSLFAERERTCWCPDGLTGSIDEWLLRLFLLLLLCNDGTNAHLI